MLYCHNQICELARISTPIKTLFSVQPLVTELVCCPHFVPRNQCLGTRGTKWCCVHTLSTRYVTVYIGTPFRPIRRHFET